MDFTAADVNS